ncbi:PREDICTED: nucleolar protein 16 [Nanorana parkeri]|uniref:nucleolar protein 16 n=1 Tax=Nanorana parkeri TaxID=125878 RepID=UPI000854FC97|nr:PREDICTED: nucleolar protein 16 [Nanorana parkeri]
MGKVRKTRKNTFNYSVNRKKLKHKARKKAAPRIACDEIRNAWNHSKSVAGNMAEMGLAADPNKALPIRPRTVIGEQSRVRKPYVLEELKAAASLPSKRTMGISNDMILYVRHMVENYGEDHKAMARDEQNYYQDTPKQILRKIKLYKHHHPQEYEALLASRTKQ